MPIGCAYSNVESSPINSFNWLSSNVAFNLEFQAKLDLTLQYLSKLIREHPSWVDIAFGSSEASTCVKEYKNHEYVKVLESFQQKLYTVVHLLEQKFSVVPFHLISLILILLHNRGQWFVGFDILHGYTSQHHELDKSQTVDRFLSYALMHEPLLKATRETSLLFSRVIAACGITCSILKSHYIENNLSGDSRSMSLVRTILLQLMEYCLLQMSPHLMLLDLYQLHSLTAVDIDSLLLPRMELYAHGSWSDVAYVTSSGSIITVVGYSSNNVNVVIWDTLAPPSTSRASILCHEGGAHFLSVFDNDIGSGSIAPLIVIGGKGCDVGLHDFLYIATGRSKRHRHSDKGEQVMKSSLSIDMHPGNSTKFGEQSQNGMLWYIPKAHSGGVTKMSIIPNTSLFLTGSKDGDVKLWDAKRAKLVYNRPKLHERHTFL
ncbi:PREDICTED: uncharacterized protein LOC103332248 [Prunus mume]|uniref:Uncharacterized protein LOC103332248 n=1 Tax=Prunus mume TaxID=102107 RepID=A0ABM1LS22_PRUMU|nr:PREDICTED: uncharacterized protein LOC103332248 [Prunus mume]XP_016650200.1 PREDICTED: uncharacterized protein LOC103332248 [Prunus mume]